MAYGCPEVLITDQGREFVNEISSYLYAITNNNTTIIIIVKGDDGNNWVKIGHTQLTRKHKDDLLGGEWLNDSHIHAVQQLIQLDSDLQHIRVLQDPIFGQ